MISTLDGHGPDMQMASRATHSETFCAPQVAEFKEAFQLIDKEGRGAIDIDELAEVMKSLGQNPTRSELQAMIDEVDEDGEGEIGAYQLLPLPSSAINMLTQTPKTLFSCVVVDFDEFLNMMAKALTKEVDSKEEMMKCFKVFDKDEVGEIAREDLHHIIAQWRRSLPKTKLRISSTRLIRTATALSITRSLLI